jgi:pyruvate/2-oxoglutarate dehydrogenase complex dihydrolipoamide acyltransferase (E2) component
LSTPAVRHLAKKSGININLVPGTGKSGRVTKTDIQNFIQSGHGTAFQASADSKQQAVSRSSGIRIAALTGITDKDR